MKITRSINFQVAFLFAILFCVSAAGTDENTGPSVEKIISAPLNGGPRKWEVNKEVSPFLNLSEKPSTGSKIIDRYRPGTILYNIDGCMTDNDVLIWCNIQKSEGGAHGYVLSGCIKPAVGPDGTVPTGFYKSAIRAGGEKFDAKGQIPCIQHSGQPVKECSFVAARSAGGYYCRYKKAGQPYPCCLLQSGYTSRHRYGRGRLRSFQIQPRK